MASLSENTDIKAISEQQVKLETLRIAKESPQDLQKKLLTLRPTYLQAVNEAKMELNAALQNNATFKSQKAKEILRNGVLNLAKQVENMAETGRKIKEKKDGVSLSSLDTLKASLSAELAKEKTNIAELREIENSETNLKRLLEINEGINKDVQLGNLSSKLNSKQQLLKQLVQSSNLVNRMNFLDPSLNALVNELKNSYSSVISDVNLDVVEGQKIQKIKAETDQKTTELFQLEQQIKLKLNAKNVSTEDFKNFSEKVKAIQNSLAKIYADGSVNDFYSGFCRNVAQNLETQLFMNSTAELDKVYVALSKIKPESEVGIDSEVKAGLDVTKARQEFSAEGKKLSYLDRKLQEEEKLLVELEKNSKAKVDTNVLNSCQPELEAINKSITEIISKYKIQDGIESKNSVISSLWKKLEQDSEKPLLNQYERLVAKSEAKDKRVKAIEQKIFNENLPKDLDNLDSEWQRSVNEHSIFDQASRKVKQFESKASPDTPQYKKDLEEFESKESNLMANIIKVESKVNLLESLTDSNTDAKSKARLKEYQDLAKKYFLQISNNRNLRIIEAAVKSEKAPLDLPGGQLDGNKKLTDYVVFINRNDPNFDKINGGKGWDYLPGLNISENLKQSLAVQAEVIVGRFADSGKNSVDEEKQSILTKNRLYDKSRELLGEKAKAYYEAADLLFKGDNQGALGLFKDYLRASESFDDGTKKLHQGLINEAKNQIEIIEKSAGFYEGIKLIDQGKLNEGVIKLREFIRSIPEEKKKQFAEQLLIATESLKRFNEAKLNEFVELATDLLTLKNMEVSSNIKNKRFRANFLDSNQGGEEMERVRDFYKNLEARINQGEPLDFNEEFQKFKVAQMAYMRLIDSNVRLHPEIYNQRDANGNYPVSQPDSTSQRLIRVFDLVSSTDPEKRKTGFTEAAMIFKGKQTGMHYTQKYLDKALKNDYAEYLQSEGGKALASRKKQEVLSNPAFIKEIQTDAVKLYEKWVNEQNNGKPLPNPPLSIRPSNPQELVIFQRFKTQLLDKRLKSEVNREIRNQLTLQGKISPALREYNISLPYNNKAGERWKPWTWANLNEDQWEEFKVDMEQFALETVATLPIGMGAGAIGKIAAKAALRKVVSGALLETAATALENGGIRALMAEKALVEGMSTSARWGNRALMMGAWGVGVVAEGTSMMAMNSIWEGLSTGKVNWLEDSKITLKGHFAESVLKVLAFRAMGAVENNLLKIAGENPTLLRKAGTIFAGEVFSGGVGAGIESVAMLYHGQKDQITKEFFLKSIVQNALQSAGMRFIHSGGLSGVMKRRTQIKLNEIASKISMERLNKLGVQKNTDITDVYTNVEGEVVINGKKYRVDDVYSLPKDYQEAIRIKSKEKNDATVEKINNGEIPVEQIVKTDNGKIILANGQVVVADLSKFSESARKKIEQLRLVEAIEKIQSGKMDERFIVAVENGQIVLADGIKLPIDGVNIHKNYQEKIEALNRLDVNKQYRYTSQIVVFLFERASLESKADLTAEEKARLEEVNKQIAEEVEKSGLSFENFSQSIIDRHNINHALVEVYAKSSQLYSESRVVTINGQQINLFKNFESKTSAYSKDLLQNIDYQSLMKVGGSKLIKIGGDELVLYHAGADGQVQKLFIDISNMGPANDVAMNIQGTKVNLVDVYLSQVSEKIKAISAKSKGKNISHEEFAQAINQVVKELFYLDQNPQTGKPYSEKEVRANFHKLKKKWNLEGSYEDYLTSVKSMRIMAEYRADTRGLNASFDPASGKTFSEHINSQIEALTGKSIKEIQDIFVANQGELLGVLQDRVAQSPNYKAKSLEELMKIISKLDPKTSAPEDLMMVYSLMARINLSKVNSPALRQLSKTLEKSRSENIGNPPRPRVDKPRIMDAKVVQINLPPDIQRAIQGLANTDPVQAHAILTAARTLAEGALDKQKYSKKAGFAEFKIHEHLAVKDGKIVFLDANGDFAKQVAINQKDAKVDTIARTEEALAKSRKLLEALRREYAEGKIDSAKLNGEIEKLKIDLAEFYRQTATDPDTGARSQAFLDQPPTSMFEFKDGIIPPEHRAIQSVTVELGQTGALNSALGYTGTDGLMKIMYQKTMEAIAGADYNIQHVQGVRSGGKIEIFFMDQRELELIKSKGLTPDQILQQVTQNAAQAAIKEVLEKLPPEIKAKLEADIAVRNSAAKFIKGKSPEEAGQIYVSKVSNPIDSAEISAVLAKDSNLSSRQLISKINEAKKLGTNNNQSADTQALKISPNETSENSRGIDKLFYSVFDKDVPKELPGNSEGWIDKEGRIHYNINYLNGHLASGYQIIIVKGDARIRSPDGSLLTLAAYEKLMRDTEHAGVLINEMKKIKTHESIHQVLEFVFNKMGIANDGIYKLVEDKSKTKPILELFAVPDANGIVPPGKIPLIDVNGKPLEVNWKNVQEYFCHVGDGSIKSTPSQIALFERHISTYVPNFRFAKVRSISTKLLVANPVEAFARESMAAKEGEHLGKPWEKITSSKQFNEVLSTEKGQESNFKIAHEMLKNFMWILRSGDKAQIESFKESHQHFVDKKVFDQFENEMPVVTDKLAGLMLTQDGLGGLMELESQGKLSSTTREVFKRLAAEASTVVELLSKTNKDGKAKSPEQIKQDLQKLTDELQYGIIGMNKLIIDKLSRSSHGLQILADLPGGLEKIKGVLKTRNDIKFEILPDKVKEQLRNEAIALLNREASKVQKSIDDKVSALEAEYQNKKAVGDNTENIELKLKHALDLQKIYRSLDLNDPIKMQEILKEMEMQKPPQGFEDSPSPSELFYANYDNLGADFLVKILDGKITYETCDSPTGKQKVVHVEGRNLGIGGLGEVWASVVFAGKNKQGKEIVMKKSKVNFKAEQAIDDFGLLDFSTQNKLKQIVEDYKQKGVKMDDGIGKAINDARSLVISGHQLSQLNSMLVRYKAAYQEANNVRTVMAYQGQGKLKGFTEFNYVSKDGIIFMESIANPKANYAVCDYEQIILGQVKTLDGQTPITENTFWKGMTKIFEQLGEAHSLGIVHRDLKPENLAFGSDGQIRLIDVGSVKNKDNMSRVLYYQLTPDMARVQFGAHPNSYFKPGESIYYFPEEGGVTLGYYKGDVGYKKEFSGEKAADGKPEYSLGYSDRVAMAQILREIVEQQKNPVPGQPIWVKSSQVSGLENLIQYLEQPRADITEASKRLAQIMGIK